MNRPTKPHTMALCFGVTMLLGACGGKSDASERKSIEQALAQVTETKKMGKEDAGAAMKKLKERAAEEAHAAHEAKLAALIDLPNPAPTKLADACAQVSEAFDKFHGSRVTGTEAQRWQHIREADLKAVAEACKEEGSLKVAACRAHALTKADQTVVDSDADELHRMCTEKFGSGERVAAK